MTRHIVLLLPVLIIFITACANPLNQATAHRYGEMCKKAQKDGNLAVAEQACYRALVNVDWGNLGKEEKSLRMYNLGLIKRQIGKLDEAEQLYKESLALEEEREQPSQENMGRRFAELALLYGQEDRIEKGVPYTQKLLPIADVYSGSEHDLVLAIFYLYSEELRESRFTNLADELAEKGERNEASFGISYLWGVAAEEAENYERAGENYARALDYLQKENVGDCPEATVAYSLGRIQGILCEPDDAEKHLLKALELDRKCSGPTYMSLLELARLKYDEGLFAEAADYYKSGLALVDKPDFIKADPIGMALHFEEYAICLNKINRTTEGQKYKLRAIQLREQHPNETAKANRTPYMRHCKLSN